MKVKATGNSGSKLPSVMLDPDWGLTKESSFPLVVGKEYVVFAIAAVKDVFWYYVLDEHDLPYPIWYPSPLFDVSDGSIPPHWVANYSPHPTRPDRVGSSFVAFEAWATDPTFYESLVDGDSDAVVAFQDERSLLTDGPKD